MAKNSKVRIDNYAVYAGKINHYALDAVFAANNVSGTTLSPLPYDDDDYTTDPDGTTESVYCIHEGCTEHIAMRSKED